MEFQADVIVHAVKESVGEMEGRAFSSTTFHCEVDLKENGAGRSIGRVTRPFKLGDHKEFDKWAHLGGSLPIKAKATFEMQAARDDAAKLTLKAIVPMVRETAKSWPCACSFSRLPPVVSSALRPRTASPHGSHRFAKLAVAS